MRIKTFYADSMSKCLAKLRDELGNEAIIVSSRETQSGVEIIAALEQSAQENVSIAKKLEDLLQWHGVSQDIQTYLFNATGYIKDTSLSDAMLSLLNNMNFGADCDFSPGEVISLIGPPGVGKSVVIARIAASLLLRGVKCQIIATDRHRAGSIEQLQAYSDALEVDLSIIENPLLLRKMLNQRTHDKVILVDTPGTNPFVDNELNHLHTIVNACSSKPALVLFADMHPEDIVMLTQAYGDLSPRFVIFTGLDFAYRLGHLLNLTNQTGLKIAGFAQGREIGNLLIPSSSSNLANLMVNRYEEYNKIYQHNKEKTL